MTEVKKDDDHDAILREFSVRIEQAREEHQTKKLAEELPRLLMEMFNPANAPYCAMVDDLVYKLQNNKFTLRHLIEPFAIRVYSELKKHEFEDPKL